MLFIGTQFSNLYTAVDTPAHAFVYLSQQECMLMLCAVRVCMCVYVSMRVYDCKNVCVYECVRLCPLSMNVYA